MISLDTRLHSREEFCNFLPGGKSTKEILPVSLHIFIHSTLGSERIYLTGEFKRRNWVCPMKPFLSPSSDLPSWEAGCKGSMSPLTMSWGRSEARQPYQVLGTHIFLIHTRHLKQQLLNFFWHQEGLVLWKANFPMMGGGKMVLGWFKYITFLCTSFLLLYQLYLRSSGIRSRRLGTLDLKSTAQMMSQAMFSNQLVRNRV